VSIADGDFGQTANNGGNSQQLRHDRIYQQTLKHFLAPVYKELYEDDSVSEVLINGHDEIYVERNGRIERLHTQFRDPEALQAAVNNLAGYLNRQLDEHHHSMDARLPAPEKFRVHVILPPCARGGITISIRKFQEKVHSLETLIELGALTEEARQFLNVAVKTKRNMLVSGGTSTGKTTFLNALGTMIPPHERVIIIEDSSELQLPRQLHTVYLESRPARQNGAGAVTIRDLFVDSLRMRPDRIIVGEVRRGEALDMVQSMLSGHDGAMGTIHASSPALALVRLETLCLMSDVSMPIYVARLQVSSALHLVVQLGRLGRKRQVTSIAAIQGVDESNGYQVRELFRIAPDGERRVLRRVEGATINIPQEECESPDIIQKLAPACADMFHVV